MSRRMWKAVETEARKVVMAEPKGGEGQRRSRKKKRREEEEEAKGEDSRDKKSSRGVGDLG